MAGINTIDEWWRAQRIIYHLGQLSPLYICIIPKATQGLEHEHIYIHHLTVYKILSVIWS